MNSKGNVIPAFLYSNITMGKWGVSHTDTRQVRMVGWCSIGTYLGWLIGMKVEGQHNHLHDEMQYLPQILSFDGTTWIAIPTYNFINIFSRLCGV
jgi:hypothetical protein